MRADLTPTRPAASHYLTLPTSSLIPTRTKRWLIKRAGVSSSNWKGSPKHCSVIKNILELKKSHHVKWSGSWSRLIFLNNFLESTYVLYTKGKVCGTFCFWFIHWFWRNHDKWVSDGAVFALSIIITPINIALYIN